MMFEMSSCGGCRTCEMACSFHHKGEFIPAISSIKIVDRKNDAGFLVLLVEESDGQSVACDGCGELDIPLCMQYCQKSEDLRGILKKYFDEKGKIIGRYDSVKGK